MSATEATHAETEAFMAECGIELTDRLIECDPDGREYYEIAIGNPRGSVTFHRYSPAPAIGLESAAHVFAVLCHFCYCLADSSDPDDAPYAHYAEVLEAMTGESIEMLSAFCID